MPATTGFWQTTQSSRTPASNSDWRQKAGVPYFLPWLIGQEQAWNVMLLDKDISSSQAIGMGLVQEITPFENLEDIAFCRAEEYAQKPGSVLSIVKQLMCFSNRDLRQYLEYENTLLINTIKNAEFWEKISQI